jgi:hypothetical protein
VNMVQIYVNRNVKERKIPDETIPGMGRRR